MVLHRADDSPPFVVGHRGSPRSAPENTLASFILAGEEGASWVELDARLAADTLVVCHDPFTPDGRPVCVQHSGELARWGIVRLDDVLDQLPAELGVDVELKNIPGEPDFDEEHAIGLRCNAVLVERPERPLVVTSFNPGTLAAMAGTGLCLGLLSTAWVQFGAAVSLALELGAELICPHADSRGLDASSIEAARASGLGVMVWTVDDPASATRFADLGVDAICTNDPAGISAALRQRP